MRADVTTDVNCIVVSDASECKVNIENMVKITTRNQFECLVALMNENPEIAKGFFKCADKNYLRNFWKQTAIKLNSLGPPVRDGEGWQKVWNDYKLKTKKKVMFNKQLNAKGGRPNRQHIFNRLEETVIKLMCLDKVMFPPGSAFGATPSQDSTMDDAPPSASKILSDVADDLLNEEHEPTTSFHSRGNENENQTASSDEDRKPSPSFLRKHGRENHADNSTLLESDTEIHQNMYDTIAKSLKNIEENTKESTRVWQKILAIKEEKLAVYKRNVEEKAEYRREKQKLRRRKLELKRLKLDQRLRSLEEKIA